MRGELLFAAGCFLPASTLAAQSVDSVLARQVERSSLVRLRVEGARITGRLVSLGGGAAALETETGRRAIDLSGVDTIWVRGRATGTGAIIGSATGAVAFGTFLAILVPALCDSSECNTWVEGAVVGGLMGAAGGALLGAGIGALIPKWKRRYP
jgi:hypothetical protein